MRKLWRGTKLAVGLTLSLPLWAVGIIGYVTDRFCDWAMNKLAQWAKR